MRGMTEAGAGSSVIGEAGVLAARDVRARITCSLRGRAKEGQRQRGLRCEAASWSQQLGNG